mgnify:CR=1 FL=1
MSQKKWRNQESLTIKIAHTLPQSKKRNLSLYTLLNLIPKWRKEKRPWKWDNQVNLIVKAAIYDKNQIFVMKVKILLSFEILKEWKLKKYDCL